MAKLTPPTHKMRIQIISWLSRIGQAGIDGEQLTLEKLCEQATKITSHPISKRTVLGILEDMEMTEFARQKKQNGFINQFRNLEKRFDAIEKFLESIAGYKKES